jgi:hypothetical protein
LTSAPYSWGDVTVLTSLNYNNNDRIYGVHEDPDQDGTLG